MLWQKKEKNLQEGREEDNSSSHTFNISPKGPGLMTIVFLMLSLTPKFSCK